MSLNKLSIGHLKKAYYRTTGKQNRWNDPVHTGRDNWKQFHGPRLKTNARLIEQMDAFEREEDITEARKQNIIALRNEQLDRFWRQKRQRVRLERATSWTPFVR